MMEIKVTKIITKYHKFNFLFVYLSILTYKYVLIMKKNLSLLSGLMLSCTLMISCVEEEPQVESSSNSVANYETMKTPEMKNFENAMKSLGKPENRPTPEEIASNGGELSERRLLLLLDAAKLFLVSEGISDERLNNMTTKEIVAMAFETRTKKLNDFSADVKKSNTNN